MDKYIIDACSLINAAKNYSLGKRTFRPIWEKIENMIEEGYLISSVEVREEIKDDDLVIWCGVNSKMFLPLTEAVQKKATEILREYPTMIKLKSVGNSSADPFLIATAIIEDAIVVTDESLGSEASRDYHIPNICHKFNIECISLNVFLDKILE